MKLIHVINLVSLIWVRLHQGLKSYLHEYRIDLDRYVLPVPSVTNQFLELWVHYHGMPLEFKFLSNVTNSNKTEIERAIYWELGYKV